MNKVNKYSLGYAIGNSIQENKNKIAKLEKKVENLKNKNKKLQRKLEEKDKVIDELYKYFNNFDIKSLEEQGLGVEVKEFIINPLEILERGKNDN